MSGYISRNEAIRKLTLLGVDYLDAQGVNNDEVHDALMRAYARVVDECVKKIADIPTEDVVPRGVEKVSVSKWAYSPLMCDGIVCAGDCDYCGNRERAEAFKTLQTDYEVCRNELCLRCGDYKQAHLGACDDCRWRH